MTSKNPKPPALEEDTDAALFRNAMAGVKRVAPAQHIALPQIMPSTRPRQQEADDRAVMKELLANPEPDLLESGDTLLYRIPGLPESVFRRLRRGQYKVQDELDLHGLNREKARVEVGKFIARCHDRGFRCARIVHGKGNGSPNSGPVIKTYLDGWLRRRSDVLAFCSARPVDGGTGAVYVLLRTA
ncbi:MAG: Smr/MutS family protein [Stenotrophobium sp.]